MEQTNQSGPTPETSAPKPLRQPPPEQPALTPVMLDAVRSTGPWLRFFSILGFVVSAIMVIIALFMLVSGLLATRVHDHLQGGLIAADLALLYLVLACVCFVPVRLLCRGARGARDAGRDDLVAGVETAVTYQRAFWRFVGVVTILVLFIQVMALIVVSVGVLVSRIG